MSESTALPLLFTQLQARYPTSGLLTELVQIDVDRCVVRALVQLGSMTLATSMATAATVEQAEDQARLRVLALLGIHTTSFSSVPTVPFSSYSTPAPPLATFQGTTQLVDALDHYALDRSVLQDTTPTAAALPDVEAIAPPLPFPALSFEPTTMTTTTPVAAVEPYKTDLTVPARELETFDAPPDSDDAPYDDAPYDDASYNAATYEEELVEEHEPLVEASSDDRASADVSAPAAEEPVAKSKPRKSSADKTPPLSETDTSGSPSSNSPSSGSPSRDLSSLISQIGVEIDRIGWSKRQGSTYLQKTYGKKTRSELTDDELEDFLTYLNTQPSATVTS